MPLLAMLSSGVKGTAAGFGHKITLKDRFHFAWYMWAFPGPMRGFLMRMQEYLMPWYRLTFTREDIHKMEQWNEELLAGIPQVHKKAD